MRVGDAERNEVAEALSRHYSDGRLDETEFKDRLDKAMGAKTRADLAGILTDLPRLGSPAPPDVPHRTRHRTALWVALAVVLFVTLPWHAVGPWWWSPWIVRIPWLIMGVVAVLAWRAMRRRRHPTS